MKRDMDLCRAILLHVEGLGLANYSIDREDFPNHDRQAVIYNADLLINAGFIEGRSGGSFPMVSGLTWAGHEFLDAARDDTVWNKGKAAVAKAGGGLAFEVLKSVLVGLCTQAAKSAAGIP
ncbi:MAG: DUF2513 domain-containing protein [Rhodospirillaceae bacterium]